jgi:SsrA-binding protein
MAKAKNNLSPRIVNRRARHDYFIEESLECGIVLSGSEVKSVREGRVSLAEGFARIEKSGEMWLYDVDIAMYAKASGSSQHTPRTKRKLLAHRRELAEWKRQLDSSGHTLVPLAMYFNGRGIAKVEIGLARGKQHQDKRQTLKEKEARRDIARGMTRKRLG